MLVHTVRLWEIVGRGVRVGDQERERERMAEELAEGVRDDEGVLMREKASGPGVRRGGRWRGRGCVRSGGDGGGAKRGGGLRGVGQRRCVLSRATGSLSSLAARPQLATPSPVSEGGERVSI